MSWNPDFSTNALMGGPDSLETVIVARARDIGGFEVRRALPFAKRRMVGPFVFFDQMGPAELLTEQGIDVRPHPHIGLGTATYLYQGAFHHRDSTGADQIITPGAVNWMVAGKAVSHSERSVPNGPRSLLGVQTWVALPEDKEDSVAGFEHHGAETLPMFEDGGVSARLIMGWAFGAVAPAGVMSDLFYMDVRLAPFAAMPLPDDHEDRGIYVIDGDIDVAGDTFGAGRMMVFRPSDRISFRAGAQGAKVLLLGGETLNGPRYMWWNFVSSSKERIEDAKRHWQEERWGEGIFDLPVGDTKEWIPLPK